MAHQLVQGGGYLPYPGWLQPDAMQANLFSSLRNGDVDVDEALITLHDSIRDTIRAYYNHYGVAYDLANL